MNEIRHEPGGRKKKDVVTRELQFPLLNLAEA